MATIGTADLNLADWAARLDPNGNTADIVEILKKTNEVLEDMMLVEGNLPTGHRTTVRSGLPTGTWRLLNYGVVPEKSRTVQVTDSIGMLESYSDIDKALADLNGNTAQFRLSEDMAFLEGMSQTMATALFYGSTATDPEKFMGLAPRYNSLSAENAVNIVNGGGTGSDNHSIWLVSWGPNTCHGIFPKGSKAGLLSEDKGQETLTDAAGGYYEGYRTHYKWDIGLTLRDWRYVVRIANIDNSALTKAAATGADLIDLMVQAIEKLPSKGRGKPVFYCNPTIKSFLRRQIANKSNINLTMDQVAGKHVMSFDGIPVKRCEALTYAEATVS